MGGGEFDHWNEYSPPDKSFKVLLPGTPTEESDWMGQAKSHAVTAKGGLFFAVIRLELPKPVHTTGEANRFLEGFGRRFLEKSNAISVMAIRLGSIPGREIVAEGFQGKKVRCRVCAVGNRAYQVMALSDARLSLDSDEARRFFDSFELMNLPSPALKEDRDLDSRSGQIVGTLCILGFLGLIAGVIVGWVRTLTRPWRKKLYLESYAKESEDLMGAEGLSPVPPTRPRKRYVWPLVFGSIGALLGLFNGFASLPRLEGEGSDFLFGYVVGSTAIAGAAWGLIGMFVRLLSGPRH
jgi:hypothetical protein